MKIYFLVTVVALSILSCNNDGETNASSKDANNITADTAAELTMTYPPGPANLGQDTSLSSQIVASSNEFADAAASGGMLEVEMGKLAQDNGGSIEVKTYGKLLEKDHTHANNKLKEIAVEEHIELPAAMLPEHQQHIDHLKMLKGKEFDKAFIPMMIEDHTKDIIEFEKAAATNSNVKIKAFAAGTLPVLKTHLAKAKSLKS